MTCDKINLQDYNDYNIKGIREDAFSYGVVILTGNILPLKNLYPFIAKS